MMISKRSIFSTVSSAIISEAVVTNYLDADIWQSGFLKGAIAGNHRTRCPFDNLISDIRTDVFLLPFIWPSHLIDSIK